MTADQFIPPPWRDGDGSYERKQWLRQFDPLHPEVQPASPEDIYRRHRSELKRLVSLVAAEAHEAERLRDENKALRAFVGDMPRNDFTAPAKAEELRFDRAPLRREYRVSFFVHDHALFDGHPPREALRAVARQAAELAVARMCKSRGGVYGEDYRFAP